MVIVALVVFGLTALGGITLAALHLAGRPAPTKLAVVHGLGAAGGLVLLIIALARGAVEASATASLILFLAAAVAGFYLFVQHTRGASLRRGLIAAHGLAAAIAFAMLLIPVLSG